MQRWELKYHWLPGDVDSETKTIEDYNAFTFTPTLQQGFRKGWAEAEVFANDGWELVSISPLNKGYVASCMPTPNESIMVDHGLLGQSYGHGCSFNSRVFACI